MSQRLKKFSQTLFFTLAMGGFQTFGVQAQPLTGFHFLNKDAARVDPTLLAARKRQVVDIENLRRQKANVKTLGAVDDVLVLQSLQEYEDIGRKQGFSIDDHRTQFGAPYLMAQDNWVMAAPDMGRYNHNLKVYFFSGSQLTGETSFSEFSIQKMPGDEVTLYRVLTTWGRPQKWAPVRALEEQGWRKRNVDDLLKSTELYIQTLGNDKAHQTMTSAYKDLCFHFSVNGIWTGASEEEFKKKSSEYLLKVKVPKSVLLDLAAKGHVVVGHTMYAHTEFIVYRQAWPVLMKYIVPEAP